MAGHRRLLPVANNSYQEYRRDFMRTTRTEYAQNGHCVILSTVSCFDHYLERKKDFMGMRGFPYAQKRYWLLEDKCLPYSLTTTRNHNAVTFYTSMPFVSVPCGRGKRAIGKYCTSCAIVCPSGRFAFH